ncbi:recombinase family protein [Schleiferiaceae bacterium]|jgi:DNA invertase Pin-like site-specific DNA recombinase|nr:recombinase family protein [Schleiferiaceae bacterium]MDG1881494.1 recombinase family protein [Schleiferiaceae bacterium]|tara:strand:- start:398 stop:1018 length:621 start_codon:yes stop_codon:yes gene_type:complete
MKVKYNRTSTIQQEGKRFDLDKNEYDLTLFDKGVSGKIPFSERTEGNKLTQLVNDGKVSEVVVEELSRLGRNTIDTLTTLKFFEDNEVNVIVKSMGNLQSMVNGKKNPIWNLITSVMSSLYELERENILERTEMGRKMYVMNGGKLGRKIGTKENRSDFLKKEKTQKIISLLEKGKSVRDISGRLGVSTKTVVKVRKYVRTNDVLV